jgi:hypothetical protein
MAVTVRRPNSICIFGGRREKPGKRCKVKKYRTQRRFSVRAKDRGSRALWHRGDGDPEPVHLEEIDTTFAIEWKGQYRIDGPAFVSADPGTGRGTTVLGYPTQKIAQAGRSETFRYI